MSEAENTAPKNMITMSLFIGSLLARAYSHVSWNAKDGGQLRYISHIFLDFLTLQAIKCCVSFESGCG